LIKDRTQWRFADIMGPDFWFPYKEGNLLALKFC